MLDIALFRIDQGGNPELIKESQKRRFKKVEDVDKVIELDTKWRAGNYPKSLTWTDVLFIHCFHLMYIGLR